MGLRQIITIALTEDEYHRWGVIAGAYSQHELFSLGLTQAELAEGIGQGEAAKS
jgi:hypothetical protein